MKKCAEEYDAKRTSYNRSCCMMFRMLNETGPVVLHPAYVSKQIQFPFHDNNNNNCRNYYYYYHGKETEFVWIHMQDEGQHAGEGGDVWNEGKRIEERKTLQTMVG